MSERYRWLVKIRLLEKDMKLSVTSIHVFNEPDIGDEVRELSYKHPFAMRTYAQHGRTRYRDEEFIVKLKDFYSVTPHTPPVADIYEWLHRQNSLIRTVNKRDA